MAKAFVTRHKTSVAFQGKKYEVTYTIKSGGFDAEFWIDDRRERLTGAAQGNADREVRARVTERLEGLKESGELP